MQVIKPVGRDAAAKKYDILSALMAHAFAQGAVAQRLVLRLMALITTRYNWQRDELCMGQREIARLWCVDERTVKREMAQLRAMGWIRVKRQGARGRVSVLGIDLERILLDTRPAWPNIGEDYVARMAERGGEGNAIPSADANVVPFRRSVPATEPGLWGRMRMILNAEDPVIYGAWFAPLIEIEQAEGILTLAAPSRFHATYLRTHLLTRLETAGRRLDPSLRGLRIEAP
ncbi:hypothetical protein KY389_11090 [Paracoccus bogoriensis]|uniref:hypothetical protein n=1 Tax=Paracoccus bogoriensis TaxID=242065 RepID=UPI001CA5A281|nr:hypothetical protein [Paracoccus bogoriensis]MBW7057231.1 hypothetical protein [Paracoccus bogoriensis]